MEILESLRFAHSYEYEVLEEIPSVVSNNFYIPVPSDSNKVGPGDGLMLKISPNVGNSYLCTVAGSMSAVRQSKIYSTPNPDKICVVVGGDGYIFSTTNPKVYERVKCSWVQDTKEAINHGLLIFTDYDTVVAYNSAGLKWQTKRFDGCDMIIKEITETHVIVEYESMGEKRSVAIELETGKN